METINRSEVSQALAKAIAFKNCGKNHEADAWAAKLVQLLGCGGILVSQTHAANPSNQVSESPKFTKDKAGDAMKWIRESPAAHFILKDALEAFLKSDPVDALKDVGLLHAILDARCRY